MQGLRHWFQGLLTGRHLLSRVMFVGVTFLVITVTGALTNGGFDSATPRRDTPNLSGAPALDLCTQAGYASCTATPTPASTSTAATPPATSTNTTGPVATGTATPEPTLTSASTDVPTSTQTSAAVIPGPLQPTTLYFAEGYTGRFATNRRADFDEFISVLNPDGIAKAVTLTYRVQGQSAPVIRGVIVSPHSDMLENVNGDVGNDKIVSTIITSDFRITAERIQNRTTVAGRLDSDSSLGTTAPGTAWYFAEGYTGATFQEYLTVQNPSPTTAAVTVIFLPQGAQPTTDRPITRFSVPANGRATENIRRDYLAFRQKSVGMIVSSSQPIVAERVLYFGDGVGSAKYGAMSKAGMVGAATQYFFAYGSNPGSNPANAGPGQQPNDESFVTIINPAPPTAGLTATCIVQFFATNGALLGSKTLGVAAATRETLAVNTVIAPVAGPYYTIVTSDQPVFVEKQQYIGGSPNVGMHPGLSPAGSPAGVTTALFPTMDTASASGAPISETVFLLNPTASAESVNATYYAPGGQTVSVAYALAGHQLKVVTVNADAGNVPAGPLGAQYTTNTGQFVAARVANTPDQRSYIGNQGVPNQ